MSSLLIGVCGPEHQQSVSGRNAKCFCNIEQYGLETNDLWSRANVMDADFDSCNYGATRFECGNFAGTPAG